MSLQEIKSAIRQLDSKEVMHLAKWIADYDYTLWDKRLEADAKAGRLDELIRKADAGYKQGLTKPL